MKQSGSDQIRHHEKKYVLSEREDHITSPSLSFADYIRSKRKEVRDPSDPTGKKTLSIKAHAASLGLSQEMYRKILNMQKPNQSRDCIIAICAALHMDVDDTNKALHLYNSMPGLDKKSRRDRIIINVLNGGVKYVFGIETVNSCLEQYGFAPLSTIDHRKRTARNVNASLASYPYKVLKKVAKTATGYLVYGDQYDSLATMYDFSRYHCYANMWLDDPIRRCVYELTAEPEGYFSLEVLPRIHEAESSIISYESPDDAGEFCHCFIELQGMARLEQKRMEEFLNDRKNYREGIGAGIQNGRIHIFFETYNYSVPEFNEYYLFEYIDGVYRLTVSHHSLFMQKYLSEDDYTMHYGSLESEGYIYYDSVEEIDRLQSESNSSQEADILRLRENAYRQFQRKVDICLRQLRSREIFVRNLEFIWEDRDRVCAFFGVENEFQCRIDGEENDFMIAEKKEASFTLSNGTSISLSLEELYRAFELGFSTIEEVCLAKIRNGSVEATLM